MKKDTIFYITYSIAKRDDHVKESLIITGLLLMVISIFLTVVTFGISVICTGPLFFIGIIVMIVGFVFPVEVKSTVVQPSVSSRRFCTACGREIPFDARICPYCGKNFEKT